MQHGRHWVASELPLDEPVASETFDAPKVSAGELVRACDGGSKLLLFTNTKIVSQYLCLAPNYFEFNHFNLTGVGCGTNYKIHLFAAILEPKPFGAKGVPLEDFLVR